MLSIFELRNQFFDKVSQGDAQKLEKFLKDNADEIYQPDLSIALALDTAVEQNNPEILHKLLETLSARVGPTGGECHKEIYQAIKKAFDPKLTKTDSQKLVTLILNHFSCDQISGNDQNYQIEMIDLIEQNWQLTAAQAQDFLLSVAAIPK